MRSLAAARLRRCGAVLILGAAAPLSLASHALPAQGVALRWNEIARTIAVRVRPGGAFELADLHAAQALALQRMDSGPRQAASDVGRVPAAEQAAISAASFAVLRFEFTAPELRDWIYILDAEWRADSLTASRALDGRSHAGAIAIGQRAAEQVIARAKADGRDAKWSGTIPTGPGMWFSSASPPREPAGAVWPQMRTWALTSASQFRPAPPPAFDSPQYKAALEEVRQIARTRTPEQVRIAWFWNDGPGGGAPIHWNEEMAGILARHQASEREAVHALELLNLALADARIACWDAKLAYWLIRPSQADTTIALPVYLPNFPAYPSGHACVSGAAAAIIGSLYPTERARVTALAEEAAMSRVYGGVHYRFDGTEGLKLGRQVARFVVDRDRRGELLARVSAQ